MWYTHKNPYGCWICDVIFIIDQLRSEGIHTSGSSSRQTVDPAEGLNNTKSDEL